jgi:ATP-dependent Lhr-like helicase
LVQSLPGSPEDDLTEALWDLVWAGLVTNDTFHPIRGLSAPSGWRRSRSGSPSWSAGGRWSLTRNLVYGDPSPTAKAHARALVLLERYGVVSREVLALENLPGGFAPIYEVLKTMEESGKVRRGYFVEGLSGAQFASAGAVDQLRAARRVPDKPRALLMAATDPANPYGALLPWPQVTSESGSSPRRATGATVVMVEGEPVLYIEKSGTRALTFPAATDAPTLVLAAVALKGLALRRRGKYLRLELIDGEQARSWPRAHLLVQAGFSQDYKGLVLEVR